MTAYNYTFTTPDHSYEIIPDPLDPKTVRIQSEFKDSIEDFLKTVELAGRADDEAFTDLKINIQEGLTSYDPIFFTEVSTSDLALYFEFEVLNFMGAVPEA
jgi:hypothetical protein